MNGKPLESVHGAPLRLIIPGWPGSVSHKWLTRITLRDKVHDGPGMTGTAYRTAIKPMLPGGRTEESNLKILESMPVRSIITNPASGTRFRTGTKELRLRGAAWAGDLEVKAVHVSIDYGATWQLASTAPPKNRYDWRRWSATTAVPTDGFYEIWVRATDAGNRAQPHVAGNWNPQGYAANPMHRIAVLIG
jgi:DMSO/TMAO reductase YedYZ molybdopterin-dependent catalytic subunit